MSPTYEKKFFKNFAEILLKWEPELMRKCREVSIDAPGCAWVQFETLADFALGINYKLSYVSMNQLQTHIRSSIDWTGYSKLDPKDNFILAMSAYDLDGRPIHKTIGIRDDGGPPDASEIALYPKIAFAYQCPGCSKSVVRKYVVKDCGCGERLVYCGERCLEYDLPHHIALEH